ncbi:FlgD immunoglobulin-like domain containing protein [Candidatus Marinimicrobia bacterium]|nr:FlgD immunoglobulin-like domain containing protein [Candidatus Neomarinimicrobiota bacterium]
MNYLIKPIIFLFVFDVASTQYAINNYSKTFQDSSRLNREILTEIYYPVPLQNEDISASDGPFPIILFGHGFLINWDTYQNLWDEIVPQGYIMVFPRTESGLNTDHQQFGWDLQFLVTKIQEEGDRNTSPIYNLVHNNTALMGHSMGGGASFLAADSLCVNNNNQLKTIIGLAVAESSSNGVSSIASALNVTIPALIISGSQDGVTPPDVHQLPIYNNLSSNYKTIISILGGGHCYFGNPNFFCDLGESASSNGISISRVEQQRVTFDFLNSWLDFTLKDDCEQHTVFQDSLVNSISIAYNQFHLQNPVASITDDEGVLIATAIGIGYQWYLNDSVITNANNISYVPTLSGEYTVEVFFPNGCPTLSGPFSFNYQLMNDMELLPTSYLMHQNYPNPFNPATIIRYELPYNEFVSINIYDVKGVIVKSLINKNQRAGNRSIIWDATNNLGQTVSAGLYVYTIQVGGFRQSRKMVLVK